MSRGLGAMHRSILAALEASPAVDAHWETWGTPEGASMPPVRVWRVRDLQTIIVQQQGDWCEGRRHSQWIRTERQFYAPPDTYGPHTPHSTWRHTECASFSRALHRLMARGLLHAVVLTQHWGCA